MKYAMHSGYETQQQQQHTEIMKIKRKRKKKPTEHRFPLQWIQRAFPFYNVFRTIFFQLIENYYYYYYSCDPKPKPCKRFVYCISLNSTFCVSITLFLILLMLHFTLKVLEIRNACGMSLNRVSSILKLVS